MGCMHAQSYLQKLNMDKKTAIGKFQLNQRLHPSETEQQIPSIGFR